MEIYFVCLHKTKIGTKINYGPVSYRDYVKYERTCSFARILFYSLLLNDDQVCFSFAQSIVIRTHEIHHFVDKTP